MANYHTIIQTGLRRVLDHAATRVPAGTRLEWRPMDVSGNYPLQSVRAQKRQILFRLSKNELARCAESEEGWQVIRSAVDRQLG